MQIVRLHHAQITIPAGEESKAKKFYCDLLGLEEIPKPESLRSRGGFWLQLADQQVHIGVEDKVPNSLTKAHIAYQVDNLDELRRTLTSAGYKILPGEPVPGFDRFETRDPFENRLEFIQPIT